jgi:molecular chaperone GrpE
MFMNRRVRIPIKTKGAEQPDPSANEAPAVSEGAPPVVDAALEMPEGRGQKEESAQTELATPEETQEELEMWRDRAQRLQAEMENFRKRQRRLTQEQIEANREHLLRNFLEISDNLERALASGEMEAENLRQGVTLTHRALMRLLDREGIEPIAAEGQPFDPAKHEAISTIPHTEVNAAPDTVFKVVQPGYRLAGRLLRPARVVVAV